MISVNTAKKIYGIYEQIEDCKKALALFKEKQKPQYPIINVSRNGDDEGISILLLHNLAKEAVEKQLAALQGEYQALNKIALKELRD